MKKILLVLVAFCGTLVADFRKDFIDEVVCFSAMNPTELVQDQRAFVSLFYDSCYQERSGNDNELRPLFVTAQGDFERTIAHMLRENKIQGAVGIFHTPTPATPLCTKGGITEGLIDPSLSEDTKRIYTVMKRPEIIRDFLSNQGSLLVCYPEKGVEKRTEEQLKIFEELKEEFPKVRDVPLDTISLEGEMIGALYFIKTLEGEQYAFSMMARQANDPKDDSTWAIWFGQQKDEEVNQRVMKVMNFLKPHLSQTKSKL